MNGRPTSARGPVSHEEQSLSRAAGKSTIVAMTTLLEIKAAIDRLPPQEYCELMGMLHPFADDDWDRQIAADHAAGRLGGIIAEARADVAAGRAEPLEMLLAEEERAEGRP